MAQPVTFLSLRTNARQLVDQNLPNTFISETNLGTLINRSAQRLYKIIEEKFGDNYAWSTFSFTTIANQDTYTLPTDLSKLIKVMLQTSGVGAVTPTNVTLRRLLNDEINIYNNMLPVSWQLTGLTNVRYLTAGGYPGAESIILRPLPVPANSVVNIIYSPVWQFMVNDTDTFPFGQWGEFIETDCALKMAAIDRDMEMVQYLNGRLMELTAEMETAAENRDSGEPQRITDTARNSMSSYGLFGGGYL